MGSISLPNRSVTLSNLGFFNALNSIKEEVELAVPYQETNLVVTLSEIFMVINPEPGVLFG